MPTSRSRAKPFPMWKRESALTGYLVGVLLGDGTVCESRNGHSAYVALEATDYDFVHKFCLALRAVAPPGFRVTERGPFWTWRDDPVIVGKGRWVRLHSAKVSSVAFARGLKERYGSCETRDWSVDGFLARNPSKAAMGSMLAGLFDSDGNLEVNSNRALIRITSTNKPGLVGAGKVARALGLHCKVVKNGSDHRGERLKRGWALQFGRADIAAMFLRLCGSANLTRKVERMRTELLLRPRDPFCAVPASTTLVSASVRAALRKSAKQYGFVPRPDIRRIAIENGLGAAAVCVAVVDLGLALRARRAWSGDDARKIGEMYLAGESVESLGAMFDRTPLAIIHALSRANVRRQRDIAALGVDELIMRMRAGRSTWQEIAEAASAASGARLSKDTVRCRVRVLSRPARGRPGALASAPPPL